MGQSNLFSKAGFSVQNGKVDNNFKAWLSKYSGRCGPSIGDVTLTGADSDWTSIANAVNAILKECAAQGWVSKANDPTETAYVNSIRGVTMIPAATEWAYAPYEVFRDEITTGAEYIETENAYSFYDYSKWLLQYSDANRAGRIGGAKADFRNSLDSLKNQVPNIARINLFVSWYGTDLRAGFCRIVPGVTYQNVGDMPHDWGCAGRSRASAHQISTASDGNVAYGGTPDDQSVIAAARELMSRNLKVAFTPFLLMDVPASNTLPDPYSGGVGQSAYPWRGRITKQYATTDKTAAVASEVAAFAGQYRAFVLHYAQLFASAGVTPEVFVLGTELRGLTWLRAADGSHPFVMALVQLAADVKALLPGSLVTYAADWSEFTPYQAPDGGLDFHLDPLWSSANIAAIGIDNYWPLSDWRDGAPNADGSTYAEIYDYNYLWSNLQGGEGYAWYYASMADRTAQTRTAITDGLGKPWVYRYKDIWNWWRNAHFNRSSAGTESAAPTAWTPQSKPIWFTELGCPSVNKGSNQPNVFYDPKSSESAFPYFSTGAVDYQMQRRAVHSVLRYFDSTDGTFTETHNPQSSVYAGRMVDLDHVYIYTWDARPYPYFPEYAQVWSDAPNWMYGHWLDGKLTSAISTGTLDSMASANTLSPRHPYIVDPATGKLDKQYADFFQAIEFVQSDPINNLSAQPTAYECQQAINSILSVLRAQKRISS